MANIDPYLEAIDNAVYGEEVRGSIRNAINAINVESEKTSDSLSTTIAEAYDPTFAYEVGDACTHKEDDGYTYLYECIANTTGEWDSNDWNQTTVIGWFGGYVASDNVKVYNFPTGKAPGSGIPPYSALSSLLTNYPNNLTIILHDTTANCYYFLDTFTSASISFRFLDVVNRISKLIVVAPNQLQPTFRSDRCLLPSASASDSGKALVVNSSGEWEAQTLSTPSGIYIYDFSSQGITESAPQIVDYDSDINYTNLSQLLAAHTNNVILHDTYGNNYFFVESLTTGSVTFRFWDWPQKTTRQIVVPKGQSSPLYLKGGNALIPNFSFVTDAGKVLTVDGVSGNAIWKTPSIGHTYSTTEKVVGTWVNGKPIYEKSFQFSNITVQAGKVYEIQTSTLNLDYEQWVGFECVATTYNIVLNCNYYGSFTPYGWSASVADDVIAITRGTDGDVTSDYVITLRYTKSTDTVS